MHTLRLKNIMTETKNLWEELNRRLDTARDRNNKVKESSRKVSKLKLSEKKNNKIQHRKLVGHSKSSHKRTIGVPDGKKKENRVETIIEEIMSENEKALNYRFEKLRKPQRE